MAKNIIISVLLIISMFFISIESKAQDIHFSQFYANPLYLNPAMAGSSVCPRLALSFRNQWPSLSGAFVTYSASYDQHVEALSGGLGLLVNTDRAGAGSLNTTQVSGIYSFRFEVAKSFFIKAGVQGTYFQRSLDWEKLKFPDMLDPRFGYVLNSNEPVPGNLRVAFADFSAGLLGHNEILFVGLAAHHLTRPYEGFVGYSDKTRLPMRYTAHVGANLNIGGKFGKRKNSETSISPNILYMQQEGFKEFQQMNYGMYLSKYPFVGGLWFRQSFENPDAVIFMVGVQQQMFKFGYSYDLTISKLANASGGAHEFSLIFQFECPTRTKKIRPIPCPSF